MKKPEYLKDNSNSSVYLSKKENNFSQHKRPPAQSKSPNATQALVSRFPNSITFT